MASDTIFRKMAIRKKSHVICISGIVQVLLLFETSCRQLFDIVIVMTSLAGELP